MNNCFLKKCFSIRNFDALHKSICFLGMNFVYKNNRKINLEDLIKLSELTVKNNSVFNLHQKVFPKYKNINQGKTVVLCGAGPSLTKYKPFDDAIHIALNRAFKKSDIEFDYIFAQDWRALQHVKEDLKNYKGKNCIKFIGTQDGLQDFEIPESYALSFENERFITDIYRNRITKKSSFAFDISSQPLGNFQSIAFPAMQFIFWTNPEKIYIVGCDSAPVGHCDGVVLKSDKKALTNGVYDKIVETWRELKKFAQIYYPDTKIISVNPVGLKGVFEDVYTE